MDRRGNGDLGTDGCSRSKREAAEELLMASTPRIDACGQTRPESAHLSISDCSRRACTLPTAQRSLRHPISRSPRFPAPRNRTVKVSIAELGKGLGLYKDGGRE